MQIQAALGEGHVNLVQARELLLSKTHLGLAMEYVQGGNLTNYVMSKYDSTGIRGGMYMTESEAQYFFKVGTRQRFRLAHEQSEYTYMCA